MKKPVVKGFFVWPALCALRCGFKTARKAAQLHVSNAKKFPEEKRYSPHRNRILLSRLSRLFVRQPPLVLPAPE